MAEFVEVMRAAHRMCKAHETCDECVLDRKDSCAIDAGICNDYAAAERDVMDWAKAHPEPVYPSWKAWQQAYFPDARCTICPMVFGCECAYVEKQCPECVNRPIPAEIAEKLGIVPTKEIVNERR